MISVRPGTDRAPSKRRSIAYRPMPHARPAPSGGLLSAACRCALQASEKPRLSLRSGPAGDLLSVLSAAPTSAKKGTQDHE